MSMQLLQGQAIQIVLPSTSSWRFQYVENTQYIQWRQHARDNTSLKTASQNTISQHFLITHVYLEIKALEQDRPDS